MKCWYFDSKLTTWDLKRNECFLFYIKKYFPIKETRCPELISQVLMSWENILVLLKWTSYLCLLQNHSYCCLIVEIRVIHLWSFVTRIYWTSVLVLKYFSSLLTDFTCHVFFFNFLISMTTKTTQNLCPFQFKCFIQILTMMLT